MIAPLALILSFQGDVKDYRALIADIDHYYGWRDQSSALKRAGDSAVALLVPIVEKRLVEFGGPREDPEALRNAVHALSVCASARHTSLMKSFYDRIKDDEARDRLLGWLARVGDARVSRNDIEQRLLQEAKPQPRARNRKPGFPYRVRIQDLVIGLVRSGDKKSIKTLVNVLKDEAASGYARNYVYQNLASTGDTPAIHALVSARRGSRLRPFPGPSVKLSFDQAGRSSPVKATFRDRKGVGWALVEWEGLGAFDDLWVVRAGRDSWVDPIFTGYNAFWDTPDFGPGMPTRPYDEEIDLMALIQGGHWTRQFIVNGALTKDSDGDGFTDVVEDWLSLNKRVSDTDGDGLRDGIDKNPLTRDEVETEEQGIMKAAVDAVTVGMHSSERAFLDVPESTPPFEMRNWPGLVLPARLHDREHPGIRISVGYPERWIWSLYGPPHPALLLSDDRRTARAIVGFSSASGHRSSLVTLKRFGKDWLPIRVELLAHIVS